MVRLGHIDCNAIRCSRIADRRPFSLIGVIEGKNTVLISYGAVNLLVLLQRDISHAVFLPQAGVSHQFPIMHRRVIIFDHNITIVLRPHADIDDIVTVFILCSACHCGQVGRTVQHNGNFRTGDIGPRVQLTIRTCNHPSCCQRADCFPRIVCNLRCIRECVQRAGLKRKLCAVQRAFEKYHSILPRHILRREEASVRCAGSNAESFCSSDRLAVVCGFRHVCEGSLGVNHSAVQRITHSVSTIQHHNKISPGNRLSRIKQMIAPALNDPRH